MRPASTFSIIQLSNSRATGKTNQCSETGKANEYTCNYKTSVL